MLREKAIWYASAICASLRIPSSPALAEKLMLYDDYDLGTMLDSTAHRLIDHIPVDKTMENIERVKIALKRTPSSKDLLAVGKTMQNTIDVNLKQCVERALLAAAKEADVFKTKEVGNNSGPRVEMFLKSCGLGPGNPWCAAMVNWTLDQGDYPKGLIGGIQYRPATGRAAVRYWLAWAIQNDLLVPIEKVQRGDLGLWVGADGKGHMFWVPEAKKILGIWWIRTIEGNGNEEGSREGTKVVRKWRRCTSKYKFIRLW